MLHRLALPVLLLLLANPAAATCADASCVPSTAAQAREQLEITYQQLLKHWANEHLHRQRLINSQRIWRSFRDAECELAATNENPGEHIDAYERCDQALSQERTRALQRYLRCAETNVDCVTP
ncbi:MAG: lysozyme inhibitor LprI family protein [Pseudomonas sp.]